MVPWNNSSHVGDGGGIAYRNQNANILETHTNNSFIFSVIIAIHKYCILVSHVKYSILNVCVSKIEML